jgi:seryl-tRNA synthetase
MKKTDLMRKASNELVDLFASVALAQDEALLMDDIAKVNLLFDKLENIEEQLKSREGDQRRLLLTLYDHPNLQVRVKAVKATLAVEPEIARSMLKKIADSKEYPQAGEAGMSIWALEEGIFKPS